MYVYREDSPEFAYGEDVVVLLTDDEASRLMSLLNWAEVSGGAPPGSTLFTQLHNAGVRADHDASMLAKCGRPVSIATAQGEDYWDSPRGREQLCRETGRHCF